MIVTIKSSAVPEETIRTLREYDVEPLIVLEKDEQLVIATSSLPSNVERIRAAAGIIVKETKEPVEIYFKDGEYAERAVISPGFLGTLSTQTQTYQPSYYLKEKALNIFMEKFQELSENIKPQYSFNDGVLFLHFLLPQGSKLDKTLATIIEKAELEALRQTGIIPPVRWTYNFIEITGDGK